MLNKYVQSSELAHSIERAKYVLFPSVSFALSPLHMLFVKNISLTEVETEIYELSI